MSWSRLVGSTCSTVIDDVEVNVLRVVDVLVVAAPGLGVGSGRRPTTGGGENEVGVGAVVGGCVVVVLVEVVISASELLGAMRSGMRPSVPSLRPPANKVIATMPISASTMPLDAATMADC